MNKTGAVECNFIVYTNLQGYKNLVIQLVKQLGFDFEIEKSDLESDILI